MPHAVINAARRDAFVRRMDDAIGRPQKGTSAKVATMRGLRERFQKQGGNRIAPVPPCQCGRVDRRSPSRVQQLFSYGAFMHSLRALSASSFFMPLVFSLHIASLFLGFSAAAGFALRQLLT